MRNRKVSVDLSGGLTCDDLLTLRTFVAMGLGIGFLPATLRKISLAREAKPAG